MRIDSGNIGMESARLYKSSRSMRSSVGTDVSGSMTGSQLTSSFDQFMAEKDNPAPTEDRSETVEEKKDTMDNPFFQAQSLLYSPLRRSFPTAQVRSEASNQFQKLHEEFIRNLIDMLLGRHKKKPNYAEETSNQQTLPRNYEPVKTTEQFSMSYEESESTTFRAAGIVKTADGREISLNLNLSMSSRFVSNYSESVTSLSAQLTDPLVINLSDMPAQLSDATYFFDLDSDGQEEKLHMLTENSGYLALDKNGDGIINNGSELFGTKSGDGFSDLAMYDEDHNGWIDENDSIFNSLKIWVKDADGNDLLYTLKDKNVGAICLANADTEFSLNSDNHDRLGVIRKTGVFLYESGEVGTVQHIDLVS